MDFLSSLYDVTKNHFTPTNSWY